MAVERQTSFAAGELAPTLWGRTDLTAYPIGARRLYNFFVSPHGIPMNRPGTHMVAELGSASPWPSRLVPFNYSDEDARVVVVSLAWRTSNDFGGCWLTIYKRVGNKTVAVTWPNADWSWFEYLLAPGDKLRKLRYAQIGNVLWFVHPDARPAQLRRTTLDPEFYELTDVSFDVAPYPLSEWNGPYDIPKGGVPRLIQNTLSGGQIDTGVVHYERYNNFNGDLGTHKKRRWQWLVTRVMRTRDGKLYETSGWVVEQMLAIHRANGLPGPRRVVSEWRPDVRYTQPMPNGGIEEWVFVQGDNNWYKVAAAHTNKKPPNPEYWYAYPAGTEPYPLTWGSDMPSEVAVYPDWEMVIDWRKYPNHLGSILWFGDEDDELVTTRIYRGRDGVFGYVGETKKDQFVDDGREPDFSRPPPSGTNPFKIYDGNGNLLREEHPCTITVHENRLLLGATNERPSTIWGSAVGVYDLFDQILVARDGDAFEHEIASHRLETIRGMVSRRELLVLTSSSEWLLQGAGGGLITPNSVAAHPLSEHGSGDLAPLPVGETIFFVQRKGTVPRAIVPADARQGWAARDVATLSNHLFQGHTIVDWCYAEDPWKVLWLVRDDGILLSLTYVPEHELVAWAQHEIAGGKVEAIASIPEGNEDAVYLIVNRDGRKYLERMASRVINDVRDCMFLDSAVTYDGRNTDTAKTVTVTGASGDIFAEVTVTFVGVSNAAVGKTVQLDGVNIELTEDLGGGVFTGVIVDPKALPASMLGVAHSDWAWARKSISGLDHLNGKTVSALADGNVIDGLTVSLGTVVLQDYAGVVHVGLPYVSEFESLDAINEKGRQKILKSVRVEIEGTRGGLVAPALRDTMVEMRTRLIEDGYGVHPLRRMEADVVVSDKWGSFGRVAVRQDKPLPMAILAIARDIEYGGR